MKNLAGLRRRLSYANVMATLAFFFALTGGAMASAKYIIATDTIPPTSDLAGSTYGNPLIADGKVTRNKIADGAITSSKFDSSALAPNADELDGIDSTGFLGVNGKAADSDKLDGLDSSGFLGVNGKAADADQLDGLDSAGYLKVFATAFDSARLGGFDPSFYLRVDGKAADSDKLDGLDSAEYVRGLRRVSFGSSTIPPQSGRRFSGTCPVGEMALNLGVFVTNNSSLDPSPLAHDVGTPAADPHTWFNGVANLDPDTSATVEVVLLCVTSGVSAASATASERPTIEVTQLP